MAPGILSLLIIIVFSLSRVWGIHPNIFNAVSNATCQPEYAWMNNVEQQSPCLTVAYVIAACVGDTWTQPALPSGWTYDSPNGTTATPCYCSWSCYNLMMACTLCQNPAYTNAITTWPSFSQNCPLNYKDQMFPQGYVLVNNASIPYYSTINPTTWPNELFNIGQAQNYTNQNHSDYWPSSSNPSSSSNSSSSGSNPNLGAIIGGTIGGAAGLLLILIGCYFLYKRRQYRRRLHNANDASHASYTYTGTPMTNTHARWPSDPSTAFPPTQTGSATLMSYTNTQPQGMGMSILSPTSYSPFQMASPPATDTASFATTWNTTAQRTQAIPII